MLKTIYRSVLDFVFPVPVNVREFEEQPASELLQLLPRSEPITQDVQSLFAYQDERVKQLIWEIKYYRNERVARVTGELLAQVITRNTDASQTYLVIPIPITDRRFKERGFNHTELLARSTLEFLPSNFKLECTALHKIRHTPKQNSIENRNERFSNVASAFSVSDTAKIKNRNIVLIDDVVTTGATLGEAKKVLLEAGANKVLCVTVAH